MRSDDSGKILRMSSFAVVDDAFVLNGRPHRILSGALHYFRVRPEQWRHRLLMLRALGLNTVETYVAWNFHQPTPDVTRFDGDADLGAFLDLAAEVGLAAIVRPGPYICAEWDNGGLPWWLTAADIPLRCADPRYLAAVDQWFDTLIPIVAERQITCGGNVLMVQVENEYGSYGSDSDYLRHLADGLRQRGIDVPLFTSDGPTDLMLSGGAVPGALATANFRHNAAEAFSELRKFQPQGPLMCAEFWDGWFDHWGRERRLWGADAMADDLEQILAAGGSVNLYMAHGGTNFGCWAGANLIEPTADEPAALPRYGPDVTSYDYDAPIDEAGRPGTKFAAFRDVIVRCGGVSGELPPAPVFLPPSTVQLDERVGLFGIIDSIATARADSPAPLTFEELGVPHGLVLYRSTLPGPRSAQPLTTPQLGDRAQLFIDARTAGVLARAGIEGGGDLTADTGIEVSTPAEGARIDLLVESMGRVNYGPALGERKGLVGGVRHGRQFVHGWTCVGLDLTRLPAVDWSRAAGPEGTPMFGRGWLDLDEPADAFVGLDGFAKGYVWVNGFGLGRYWSRGPQRTLYLPGPLLRPGRNELVVLDLHGQLGDLRITDQHRLS
jgi:beta-galactosidase